jgi:hypothetical protein
MITVKTWWTLAGVFVEGFSFPNKQDRHMAHTDQSSLFLPVVDTILASFKPASTIANLKRAADRNCRGGLGVARPQSHCLLGYLLPCHQLLSKYQLLLTSHVLTIHFILSCVVLPDKACEIQKVYMSAVVLREVFCINLVLFVGVVGQMMTQ